MIEPRYLNLRNLFNDRVFRIPQYQRFYSWKSKQRNDLYDDIKRLYERQDDDHHFMATVVCFRTSEIATEGSKEYRLFDVVDGQQRLTTLIVLLKCISLVLAASKENEEEQAELTKLLVKRDSNLILLQSNNANQRIFNSFLREGKSPDSSGILTDADRNLANAIKDCSKFANDWIEEDRSLLDLLRIVQNRLGFVVYDTESPALVYNLFEVLNSRGLEVDWLDKCKSLLMGAAHGMAESSNAAAAAIDSLQDIWGDIYRELAKVSVGGQEILRVTATLRHGPSKGKPRSAEDSLEILRNECTDFSKPEKISNHILDVAKKLVGLEQDVMLGAVTRILHARILAVALQSTHILSDVERDKALKQWEKVTFRIFGLMGKDSRHKVGEYIRLAEKIMNGADGGSRYSEIMSSLRELGADYPISEAADITGIHMYEEDVESCRYILWRYEEYLAKKMGANSTIDAAERAKIWQLRASESVEHIFPQNPEPGGAWEGKIRRTGGRSKKIEDHVHRVGNLLLLPSPINNEARRQGFNEKKLLYSKHHLRQIDDVCKKLIGHLITLRNANAKLLISPRSSGAI